MTKKNCVEQKTILLAAGGTGGHVIPAVTFGNKLKERLCNVYLITDLRGEKYCYDIKFPHYSLNLHIKTTNIKHKIVSGLNLIKSIIRSAILIRKIKPDLLIGFGGYPSFPQTLIASILNIPIILHEQNSLLSKTNQFFAKKAKLIALSYEKTEKIKEEFRNKSIFTGNIIREEIKKVKIKDNFEGTPFHIFIFGGSQGAKIFAELIPKTVRLILDVVPFSDLRITQQAAKEDQFKLRNFYNSLNITFDISDFFQNIDEIYDKTHLVIARSGALTISELSYIGLPSIFIPLPGAKNDHQYANAHVLEQDGAGWCYRENEINSIILAKKIIELIKDRKKLKCASEKLLKYKIGHSVDLLNTVLKIIDC